ncbi:MAG: hypothetical protein J6C09_00185 [Clostridia bacterium]|nr:hypothetical protein [Clostridia bacterium]
MCVCRLRSICRARPHPSGFACHLPQQGRLVEGDVNATVIAATSLTFNMFAGLELRDFAIKLYSKDDLKTFLDAAMKK